jgi:hypothetical protein
MSRRRVVRNDPLIFPLLGRRYAHSLETRPSHSEIERARRGPVEPRMLAKRLGARSRRRGREHRLLIVNAVEIGSDRAIAISHVDLGSEVGEGGVEVVDLLLESGEIR